MNCIQHIPAWARPEVTAFRNTGHLDGEDVMHQPIPASQVDQVESQLTEQIDQLIAADESPMDQAQGEIGKVVIKEFGLEATANFCGNTAEGCVSLEATGMMDTVAYGEFSNDAADIVQLLDNGDGTYAAVGAHIDRQAPGNSYIEAKNLPEGFNIFG